MNRLLIFLLIISFLGCSESKKGKAFDEFNAGVSISIDAANAMENENYELAEKLNKEAISKFENTLKIDSEHKGAASALGHSYYLINDYQKGIEWYEKANKIDSTMSINHLELGLCKINNGLGKINTGKHISSGMKSINYAIQLEQSEEMKEFAVYNLFDIGVLAIESNEPFQTEQKNEKLNESIVYGLNVLWNAIKIDSTNSEVNQYYSDYVNKLKLDYPKFGTKAE